MFKLNEQTKTIREREVTCKQFPVSIQSRLTARLARTLSPALRKAEGITGAADVRGIGPAIAELFQDMDEETAWKLQKDIVAGVTIQYEGKHKIRLNSEEAIDEAFQGDMLTFWEVVMFALEVNFGPLFERGKNLAAMVFSEPKVEQSPSTSSG